MAMNVVSEIHKLRERLSYDREALIHAVYALRDLPKDGPVLERDVKKWAKTANITNGLLCWARKLVGVVIQGHGANRANSEWSLAGGDGPEYAV
jgi:hypothetical protein